MKPKEIAKLLDMGERTVRDWLKEAAFLKRKNGERGKVALTPLLLMSSNEGREGERNGLILCKEIREQGYTGTERTVYRHLETLKQAEVQARASCGVTEERGLSGKERESNLTEGRACNHIPG
jgi:hypothetical protein